MRGEDVGDDRRKLAEQLGEGEHPRADIDELDIVGDQRREAKVRAGVF